MIVVLFGSKLTATAGVDYSQMSDEMEAHARTFPGFVDVKGFTADDGEQLTVVWWQDQATLRVWATDARYRAAQSTGRQKWYEHYKMEVAEVIRVSGFERVAEARRDLGARNRTL